MITSILAGFGGSGGWGEPSATSVLVLMESGFGGSGGWGEPSALNV